MQRNSSNPPTLSDSSFNAFYNDSDFVDCINTLNTTHGNNFKTNFYNQISGGKGGWLHRPTVIIIRDRLVVKKSIQTPPSAMSYPIILYF